LTLLPSLALIILKGGREVVERGKERRGYNRIGKERGGRNKRVKGRGRGQFAVLLAYGGV
jgi:hypothetical protein